MRYSTQFERTAAYGMTAAIATSHPLASQVGLQMLREGGNAVDAAVAAVAVLGVVEPGMTGIGGDCFVLYCADGAAGSSPSTARDARPPARPSTGLDERGIARSTGSPHAVTMPGAVDAWCRLLDDHGTQGPGRGAGAGHPLAEDGYVVHERVAFDWAEPRLAGDEHAARRSSCRAARRRRPAMSTASRNSPRRCG